MKLKTNLLIVTLAVFSIACSEEKVAEQTSIPLPSQNLEFEIYDSLVVDHLGNLTLMDISPDGSTFLLQDQGSNDILVINGQGEILYQYNNSEDGPNSYINKSGKALFINNEEYLIPTTMNLVQYKLSGELLNTFKPEFSGSANLIVSSSKSVIKQGENYFFKIQGRYPEQNDLVNSRNLEKVNVNTGEYQPIIPIPKSSKFANPEANFAGFDYYPVFDVDQDSLYFIFRNEPNLYTFSLSNLDSPAFTKTIPFEEFIERNSSQGLENGGFNIRDLLLGSINDLKKMESGEFLIFYTSGLTDQEAEEAMSGVSSDFNQIFENADKVNTTGYVIFDGQAVSKLIEKNELLSNLAKFVSRDEIWFNLNFSEVENDYSVIYKTRIVQK
ncbi:hypothetical protein [Algoriphagus halophilus]|uniref:6-bladed beta-propeller protein n=1 Tax=Algoriphagus halophilus TaxID=226505 RepID=A0A1N6GZP1_9BACT|nr:hypothetical protein [Algoriphagus halophilus]SIO13043.1 hypothetical protein SAMN05444394_3425 [Algoriphagus halophilus]